MIPVYQGKTDDIEVFHVQGNQTSSMKRNKKDRRRWTSSRTLASRPHSFLVVNEFGAYT